jgi:hypothetical protein
VRNDAGWITVLRDDERTVVYLRSEGIVSRTMCQIEGPGSPTASVPSLFKLVAPSPPLPLCSASARRTPSLEDTMTPV